MSFDRVAVTIEMAFGFGPGSSPAAGDWVDLSDWVDLDSSSPAIVATSGRDTVRAIRPGSLSLTLDNSTGRFNPRNPSGPYYGDLTNGTPVRVRVTHASTTTTRWSGFVDSGWPQQLTAQLPVVTVTAQDVLGVLAEGAAPATAFDAQVAAGVAPTHWWRPGEGGWVDKMTSITSRHTGGFESFSAGQTPFGPVVDGDAQTWGQTDADGYGVVVDPGSKIDLTSRQIISMWVQLPGPEDRQLHYLGSPAQLWLLTQCINAPGAPGDVMCLIVQIAATGALVFVDDRHTGAASPKANLWGSVAGSGSVDRAWLGADGTVHHVAVALNTAAQEPLLWIDGVPVDLMLGSSLSGARAATLTDLFIGQGNDPSAVPYQGVIDHVMVFEDFGSGAFAAPGANPTEDAFVAALYEAGRVAWAGDSLDERLDHVVTAMGLAADTGTFDPSGITTLQGYRAGDVAGLLQTVEDTEQGRIWVDRDGDLRFSKRTWAWDDTVSTTVQMTFSDDPTLLAGGAQEMAETGTVIVDDPLAVTNVAAVNSTYGRQQTAENTASVAAFGRRNAVQLSGLLHPTDKQSLAIAEWIVASQGTATPQVRQISFRVENNPTVLAPFARAVEPGWLVRVHKKAASGQDLDVTAHVIGVTHIWMFTGWMVTLTLDATRAGWSWFKWGTSTWGGSAAWSF